MLQPYSIGDVAVSFAIGQVTASRNASMAEGTLVGGGYARVHRTVPQHAAPCRTVSICARTQVLGFAMAAVQHVRG